MIDVLLRADKADVQRAMVQFEQAHAYAPRQGAKSCKNFAAQRIWQAAVAVQVHAKAEDGTAEHVESDGGVDYVELRPPNEPTTNSPRDEEVPRLLALENIVQRQ